MTRRPYPSSAWLKVVPLALTFGLAACATQPPQQKSSSQTPSPTTRHARKTVTPAPAPAAPALPYPKPPTPEVRAAFVSEMAAKYNLDPAFIESNLARAQVREATVAAMSRPAEAKPWRDYRPIFITPQRIDGGRAFFAEHREQLAKVEAQYGVPAEIIVAILGVETTWGANTGNAPVLDALYTLAFNYPRTNLPEKIARENQREAYFRDELGQLFALGKETGMDVATLTGSYAGAMGWGQFMPSSYRLYAVDGDGDGKRDLFNDLDDVFPSVANYFVQKGGWVRGQPVMARASWVGSDKPVQWEGEPVNSLEALNAAGFKPQQPLPAGITGSPIRLEGEAGDEYWLTFRNFRAIWSYNNSIRYATAVYQLAEAIAGRGEGVGIPASEAAPVAPAQDTSAPAGIAPAGSVPAPAASAGMPGQPGA